MIIVDEALKIINKFIPDKNTQSQMEIELKINKNYISYRNNDKNEKVDM
ncbi:MAG: hypothetical protein ACRCZO_20055 [Cetobacterium sp.]